MKQKLDAIGAIDPVVEMAIKRVARGIATEGQQKMALGFILEKLCGLTALEPADLSERAGGFAAGKRWVGLQIAKAAEMPLFIATEINVE